MPTEALGVRAMQQQRLVGVGEGLRGSSSWDGGGGGGGGAWGWVWPPPSCPSTAETIRSLHLTDADGEDEGGPQFQQQLLSEQQGQRLLGGQLGQHVHVQLEQRGGVLGQHQQAQQLSQLHVQPRQRVGVQGQREEGIGAEGDSSDGGDGGGGDLGDLSDLGGGGGDLGEGICDPGRAERGEVEEIEVDVEQAAQGTRECLCVCVSYLHVCTLHSMQCVHQVKTFWCGCVEICS